MIKLVGVGGCGTKAINTMLSSNIRGVTCIAADKDIRDLKSCKAKYKVQLSRKLTREMKGGTETVMIRDGFLEGLDKIGKILDGSDLIFVIAGMGGNTGSMFALLIAQIARKTGAFIIAVVTLPFHFEDKHTLALAETGIEKLKMFADTIIVIQNDILSKFVDEGSRQEIFKKADEMFYYAVRGIVDLIIEPGLIGFDFFDVKCVMNNSMVRFGVGTARGDSRARKAALKALASPFLERTCIKTVNGILINITCDYNNFTLKEIDEVIEFFQNMVGIDTYFFVGVAFDKNIGDEFRVTLFVANEKKRECK